MNIPHKTAKWIVLSLFSSALLCAEPYTLGQGYKVDKTLNLGGYFSSEFESNKNEDVATLDDVAVIAYGDLNPMISYLAEFESVGFYHKNLTDGSEGGSRKFHIERLYTDLWFADDFNIRLGKQITPIGYWNTEPINVLRDMTSNPLYSRLLFPKFLTGIDINGYVPQMEGTKYHLFGQKNHDFDEGYINIPNTHFFGLAIDKEISNDYHMGGSVGEYITRTNQRTRFIQANGKFDDGVVQVLTEGVVAKSSYSDNQSDYTFSAYIQGMYRFSAEHAVVGRYEHYNDRHTRYDDNIYSLGYSYRPLYPVSLKGEYQWHSQSDENRALISFSVLF